jgi:LysR family nitrogen assimilation transcriptional regulator
MAMNIKALRYFVATVRTGSVTQAAARLNVAQPAVSRQISKLERELGTQLLRRTTRGVSLTEPGERLMARAEPILESLERARTEVEAWDSEPAGPVSVALMPAVGSLVAPDLVRQLRERHPKIALKVMEGLSAFIGEGVLRGDFDLGLVHADQELPALAAVPLLDEPMFLVGPGAISTSTRPMTLGELAGYPLLLPSPSNPLRRMIDKLAGDHGIALDIRETIDSTSAIKGLVLAGLGFTVQCYSYVHEEVRRGDLTIRNLEAGVLKRNWTLVHGKDAPLRPAVAAVATVMEEIAAGLARTHRWHPPAP